MAELKLSGILNMLGEFATIRRTIAALAAQTARENLEVVIVTTPEQAGTIDCTALALFGAYQIVEVNSLPTGAYGWAQGIQRARSPIVVMCEDHSFPASNWAQSLIDAHRSGEYFAVCPAMENGNPHTCTSWANFLLSFGEWFSPDGSGEVPSGVGHNTSYNREALLAAYGDNLEQYLNPERVMHADAIAKGRKILLEARTSSAHVNISLPTAYFGMSYTGGRIFGAARAARWGWGRKVFYAAAFGLVPFVRLKRLTSYLNTAEKRRKAKFWRSLPLIMMGLFCHAFGEAMGYLVGFEGIVERYANYELRRRDYLLPGERAELLGPPGSAGALGA